MPPPAGPQLTPQALQQNGASKNPFGSGSSAPATGLAGADTAAATAGWQLWLGLVGPDVTRKGQSTQRP